MYRKRTQKTNPIDLSVAPNQYKDNSSIENIQRYIKEWVVPEYNGNVTEKEEKSQLKIEEAETTINKEQEHTEEIEQKVNIEEIEIVKKEELESNDKKEEIESLLDDIMKKYTEEYFKTMQLRRSDIIRMISSSIFKEYIKMTIKGRSVKNATKEFKQIYKTVEESNEKAVYIKRRLQTHLKNLNREIDFGTYLYYNIGYELVNGYTEKSLKSIEKNYKKHEETVKKILCVINEDYNNFECLEASYVTLSSKFENLYSSQLCVIAHNYKNTLNNYLNAQLCEEICVKAKYLQSDRLYQEALNEYKDSIENYKHLVEYQEKANNTLYYSEIIQIIREQMIIVMSELKRAEDYFNEMKAVRVDAYNDHLRIISERKYAEQEVRKNTSKWGQEQYEQSLSTITKRKVENNLNIKKIQEKREVQHQKHYGHILEFDSLCSYLEELIYKGQKSEW